MADVDHGGDGGEPSTAVANARRRPPSAAAAERGSSSATRPPSNWRTWMPDTRAQITHVVGRAGGRHLRGRCGGRSRRPLDLVGIEAIFPAIYPGTTGRKRLAAFDPFPTGPGLACPPRSVSGDPGRAAWGDYRSRTPNSTQAIGAVAALECRRSRHSKCRCECSTIGRATPCREDDLMRDVLGARVLCEGARGASPPAPKATGGSVSEK
jgi:hypothetical protein